MVVEGQLGGHAAVPARGGGLGQADKAECQVDLRAGGGSGWFRAWEEERCPRATPGSYVSNHVRTRPWWPLQAAEWEAVKALHLPGGWLTAC